MKISVNDQELFTLSDIQKRVICNDINEDSFEEDCFMRLRYILIHKYEQCFNRLKEEWYPILKERYESLPGNDDVLAELILSQPDYKNRKQRDLQ